MILNLNKHGPRDGLMQGNIHNRGSTLTSPVRNAHIMVIKPPGIRLRSQVTTRMKATDPLRLPLPDQRPRAGIAFGLPVLSQPGMPLTTTQTPPPHKPLLGITQQVCCNGILLSLKRQKAKGKNSKAKGHSDAIYRREQIKNIAMRFIASKEKAPNRRPLGILMNSE